MKKEHFVSGWERQPADERDFVYKPKIAAPPPASWTNTQGRIIPIKDQGQLGSCTAHGGSTAMEILQQIEHGSFTRLSPLYLYYFTRMIEGTIKQDSGCYVRDVPKAANANGVAPETAWPYLIQKFKNKPIKKAITAATKFKPLKYEAVQKSKFDVQSALMAHGNIIFGFDVYTSFFDTNSSGIMPDPKGIIEGGHCMALVDYNEIGVFANNSWSDKWGNSGRVLMPWEFLLSSHADDFWTISLI